MTIEEHANDIVQMLRLMAGKRKPNLLDDAADLIEILVHDRLSGDATTHAVAQHAE